MDKRFPKGCAVRLNPLSQFPFCSANVITDGVYIFCTCFVDRNSAKNSASVELHVENLTYTCKLILIIYKLQDGINLTCIFFERIFYDSLWTVVNRINRTDGPN